MKLVSMSRLARRATVPSLRRALLARQVGYTAREQAVQMQVLASAIDPNAAEFQAKLKAYRALEAPIAALHEHAMSNDSIPEKTRTRHEGRGKLLPRDRIALLTDPGTAFLELSPLAGHDMYEGDDVRAGGIITGVGIVNGVRCMIVANDSTVKGGTYYPITVRKHLRAQEIAMNNRLPCLYLADSGGANLPHQSDVFPAHNHFGRIFYQQSTMSSRGIPQLSLVLGPCTAGGAYVPAMSDEAIIVKGTGHIFLAGPPLVKAATGEVISAEELGGGDVHARISGVVDYLVESEQEGLAKLRDLIGDLGEAAATSQLPTEAPGSALPAPETPVAALAAPADAPLYPASEIGGIIGDNLRIAYDVREIIARLVDGSRFREFKKLYGTTLVTGWASIHGHKVGILANQGPLFSESALKGAHFIELCSQRGVPLVFLQNISGFMVGSEAERGGIAKNGAKLVTAVVGANVNKYTVIIGGSYGAGNYGMCGRAYEPQFLWSWPNSRTAVMGAEQLVSVMEQVGKGSDEGTKKLHAQIEHESEAIFGSARIWDDGIIRPEDTRDVLGQALEMGIKGPSRGFGVFRM